VRRIEMMARAQSQPARRNRVNSQASTAIITATVMGNPNNHRSPGISWKFIP